MEKIRHMEREYDNKLRKEAMFLLFDSEGWTYKMIARAFKTSQSKTKLFIDEYKKEE